MGYHSDVVLILKPGLEPPNYKDPDFPEDKGFLSRAEKYVSENGWSIYEWWCVKWHTSYSDVWSIIEYTKGLDSGDFELIELGESLGDYHSYGTAQSDADCPFNVYINAALLPQRAAQVVEMKTMSDHEIFEDIEECRGTEAAEAFGNCTSDIPEYPVERTINRLNQELIKLEMPYLIEDLVDKETDQYVWTVIPNTNPQKLDMSEIIKNDERGRAVYKLLVELFDELSLFFPSTLEGAVDLFKIDLEDNWCLYFFKTWLVSINAALLPQRAAQVVEAIERNTYQG